MFQKSIHFVSLKRSSIPHVDKMERLGIISHAHGNESGKCHDWE